MFDKLKSGIQSIVTKVKIKELQGSDLDPIISELHDIMIRNEVATQTADAIGEALKTELLNIEHSRFKSARPLIEEALQNAVKKILEEPMKNLQAVNMFEMIDRKKETQEPFVICVLGINGTGKTTSIAKIAHLLQKNEYSVVLAASDTYRAGSIEQLGKHADNLGVKMVAGQYKGDPAAVAVDAIMHAESKGIDVVIVDTAGRMQNNVNLVRELDKIIRQAEPDLKIFVGDSLAGHDVLRQADQFARDVGIDGIIMTKLDSDVKGGAVISVAHVTGKPILFVGIGEGYDDLIPFNPDTIIKEVIP